MTSENKKRSFVLGAVLLICSTPAGAGVITSIGQSHLPGFSTGSIGPIGANPAPNNDNSAAPSPNTIPYSIFFNSPGLLEVEFNVTNSGGTTEYLVSQSFISINQKWKGFQFELGYGTGANFVRSSGSDSLDFDAPDLDPAPFSPMFPTVMAKPDVLSFSGNTILPVGVAVFRFSIDVPDNLSGFHPGGVNSFTLRQTPATADAAVPEPATTALFGVGLAGIGLLLKKRRSA